MNDVAQLLTVLLISSNTELYGLCDYRPLATEHYNQIRHDAVNDVAAESLLSLMYMYDPNDRLQTADRRLTDEHNNLV